MDNVDDAIDRTAQSLERMSNDINALLNSTYNSADTTAAMADPDDLRRRDCGPSTRSRTAARRGAGRSVSCDGHASTLRRDIPAPPRATTDDSDDGEGETTDATVLGGRPLTLASMLDMAAELEVAQNRLTVANTELVQLRDDNSLLRFERDGWKVHATNTADERLAAAEQIQSDLRDAVRELQQRLSCKEAQVTELEAAATSATERFVELTTQQQHVHSQMTSALDTHEATKRDNSRLQNLLEEHEQQHAHDTSELADLRRLLEAADSAQKASALTNSKLQRQVDQLRAAVNELQRAPTQAGRVSLARTTGGTMDDWLNVSSTLTKLSDRQDRQEEVAQAVLSFLQTSSRGDKQRQQKN